MCSNPRRGSAKDGYDTAGEALKAWQVRGLGMPAVVVTQLCPSSCITRGTLSCHLCPRRKSKGSLSRSLRSTRATLPAHLMVITQAELSQCAPSWHIVTPAKQCCQVAYAHGLQAIAMAAADHGIPAACDALTTKQHLLSAHAAQLSLCTC
jgi:hypothetical protein